MEKDRELMVHEIQYTLQGEGYFAGYPAVFVRLAGCNLWSGHDEDRDDNQAKGFCAVWCDTEFRGVSGERGGKYSVSALIDQCAELWPEVDDPHDSAIRKMVVFTGGEPGLQVNNFVVQQFCWAGWKVHMESNGTVPLPKNLDWLVVSPKPPSKIHPDNEGIIDEMKVLYPVKLGESMMDPRDYEGYTEIQYVQPLDEEGLEMAMMINQQKCVKFVLNNPQWKLSLQTHKILEIP